MLTFRSSKVIYYGPHACGNCGDMVVKMGMEFGGNTFDQPSGPIYPNTEWYPHVCDPKKSKRILTGEYSMPPNIQYENKIIGGSPYQPDMSGAGYNPIKKA